MCAALLLGCAAPAPAPDAAPDLRARIPSRPPPAPGTAAIDATRLPAPALERREIVEPLRGVPTIDRTQSPDDLWERLRRGFAMQDLDNALVREKTAYYAARPEYLQRIVDRSRLYLYHIVEEIERRGLPAELALLPMVESAFNPMAYSRAHASGLWQFIPGTGRRYELAQNWWYDGRRDIVDSTNAALEYLTALYEMHGDWQLALASYNWGEGAVRRAMERNRAAGLPADYENLRMPDETRHYIPKLQALKNIVRDPKPFGITLDPIPNQPYFATYEKLRDIDVQLAARLAEMPVEEFIALNPGFSRPIIRASVTPRIVLPAEKVEVFQANLEKHRKSLVSWKTYNPKKGETLESIARKHGMTLAQLKEVNGIAARSRAVPGLLVVPTSAAGAAALRRLPIMYAPPIPIVYRRIWHTVKPGETLASIARRYDVTTLDLRRWNPGARVSAGQRVAVDVRSTPRPKAKPRPVRRPR
ncbi:MAG TPA: transglycosylase SLT domain-containing protein [Burkholderiales bacterium]|nr:transglycosylase SLT domain-containing protein [Burkholderiales bacterium]